MIANSVLTTIIDSTRARFYDMQAKSENRRIAFVSSDLPWQGRLYYRVDLPPFHPPLYRVSSNHRRSSDATQLVCDILYIYTQKFYVRQFSHEEMVH